MTLTSAKMLVDFSRSVECMKLSYPVSSWLLSETGERAHHPSCVASIDTRELSSQLAKQHCTVHCARTIAFRHWRKTKHLAGM